MQVIGLKGVVAVAAGSGHSLALKSDGTVWAWGANDFGELGDGTRTDRSTPVQIIGLKGLKALAAGPVHSLGLSADGTVWAWGQNEFGQLGDGRLFFRVTPLQAFPPIIRWHLHCKREPNHMLDRWDEFCLDQRRWLAQAVGVSSGTF